jgi:hypothetical protein
MTFPLVGCASQTDYGHDWKSVFEEFLMLSFWTMTIVA